MRQKKGSKSLPPYFFILSLNYFSERPFSGLNSSTYFSIILGSFQLMFHGASGNIQICLQASSYPFHSSSNLHKHPICVEKEFLFNQPGGSSTIPI